MPVFGGPRTGLRSGVGGAQVTAVGGIPSRTQTSSLDMAAYAEPVGIINAGLPVALGGTDTLLGDDFATRGHGWNSSDWGAVLADYDFSDTAKISTSGSDVTSVTPESGSLSSSLSPTGSGSTVQSGTRTSPTGLNVLDFRGGQRLVWDPAMTPVSGTPMSVAMVVASDTATPGGKDLLGEDTNGQSEIGSSSGSTWQYYSGNATVDSGVAIDTNWHVVVAIYNGASSSLWLDGTQIASGNPGFGKIRHLLIGGHLIDGASWDGVVGQSIHYDGVVNPVGISSALRAKWIAPVTTLTLGRSCGDALMGALPAGWTPAQLTGLNAWYDASNAGSITSSGGTVSQWNDLSGHGYHMTQATGANQPTTGAHTQNGLNVFDFGGSHYMTADAGSDAIDWSPYELAIMAYINTASAGYTRVISSRRSSTASPDYQSPNYNLFRNSGTTDVYSGPDGVSVGPAAFINSTFMLFEMRGDGSTGGIRVDAGAELTGAVTAPANQRYLRVGADCDAPGNPPTAFGSSNLTGRIGEIVHATADIAEERRLLRLYIATKWGTPSQPTDVATIARGTLRTCTDTLLGSDAAVGALGYARTATDTLLGGDTASGLRVFARTASDVLLGADSATGALNLARTASDALLGADSATRAALALSRAVSDVLLGADLASGVSTFSRTLSDTLLGSDSAAAGRATSLTASDSLLGTDSVSSALVLARTAADTLLGSDSASRALVLSRTAVDSLLGSDAATVLAVFARTASDVLLGADSAARAALQFTRTCTDVLLGTDSAAGVKGGVLAASDTLLGSDSASANVVLARTTSDVLLGADAVTRAAVFARTCADVLLGGDAASRSALAFARTCTDVLLGTDSASGTTAGGQTRTATDALLGTDSVARVWAGQRTVSDVLLGADSATGAVSLARTTTDQLLGADASSRVSETQYTTSDVLLGTDLATGQRLSFRICADVLLGADSAAAGFFAYFRAVTDVLLGTDVATVTAIVTEHNVAFLVDAPEARIKIGLLQTKWQTDVQTGKWLVALVQVRDVADKAEVREQVGLLTR